MVAKNTPNPPSIPEGKTGTVVLADPWDPSMDWDTLVSQGDKVAGHDLAKDDLLDALSGVPFVVTALTFRKGYLRPPTPDFPEGRQFAYVSAECVIAPERELKRRRVNVEDLPFDPNGTVVFNDGSTGIYRQLVQYLAMRGAITLPDPLTETGNHGDSTYDLPPRDWSDVHAGSLTFTDDGWADYTVDVRLVCPRGLRISEYVNDWAPNGAKTRYLG